MVCAHEGREREGFFGFRFKINGFLPGFTPSYCIQSRGSMKKGGWHIMGRLIVLCLIFLSLLSFPGNVGAITIEGAVWSTDAYKYALDPSLGPPERKPDATFEIESINFDSRLIKDIKERSLITYNQFLNNPTKWDNSMNPELGLKPGASMFPTSDPNQGIFFRFTITPFDVSKDAQPVTVIHDDGINFSIFNVFELYKDDPDAAKPVKGLEPAVTSINLKGVPPGNYSLAVLDYGALNDTANHVLIYNTPEPWTMLLLGLGMLGLGILRRKI
jgi:hypothetical protein